MTPLGTSVHTVWQRVCRGESGIGHITRFDATGFPARIAGEVRDFDAAKYLDKHDVRRSDRFCQLAIAASQEAVNDAGLNLDKGVGDRTGVYIGSAMGGLESIETVHTVLMEKGPRRVSPMFPAMLLGNLAAGHVSMRFGATGPNNSSVTACAAGAHSIGEAFHTIIRGAADVMIAGGTEATITPLAISAFGNMRALSPEAEAPTMASRPFDEERNGFVMSEGAAVLVLEELQHAKHRGASIHAELVGYGSASDAHHITAPPPDGAGAAACMAAALQDAGLSADTVDYVNAHATSTPVGDAAETMAIKSVFKDRAYSLPVSATKSMTGHMLGAAGAVESIFTVLALRRGVLPPTINYEHPDPSCDLDYVPNEARQASLRIAISNAFGFGGTNACLVFRTFD
jgi:3-oxoacyl-[acyl-carrier-protein] synthase II